ncbi:hypothetical protein GGS21DRAFT_504888 [Xylaria nigripes]|nr:hypothetical protein GGS21DRAFT_504888 [Xylaria nigripes]
MASDTNLDTHTTTNMAKAKAYYQEKRFSKSAAIFEQVANSCPCGVQTKKTRCLCKSLIPAITNSTLDAELRKKCICSAKSDVRCKHAIHIDALDGVAAVQEAKGHIDLALVTAEVMINLAPREPKGFLRLGKLLRLQASHGTAYKAYQQGIELVSKKNPSHPLLPMLYHVRDKIEYSSRAKDPLPVLPLELVAMIFKNVDFRSLCRCLRVSQSWRKLLTTGDESIQSLWRIQHFGKADKGINPSMLRRYATYAGLHVKELVAKDSGRTDSIKWLRFLLTAPEYTNLETLRLLRMQVNTDILTSPSMTRLASLLLEFEGGALSMVTPRFARNIIDASAKSLQEMTILNMQITMPLPVLENLRVLRICASLPRINIDLANLTSATPNVEQVWFDRVNIFSDGADYNPWAHLKSLYIGHAVSWGRGANRLFPMPSELEELHVMDYMSAFALLEIPLSQAPDTWPYAKNLRKLAIRERRTNYEYPEYMRRWVQPALESGSLRSLEVGLFKPLPDWLKSDQLKFLSIQGFVVYSGTDSFTIEQDFLNLLERFPNLEGIDISREPISNAALAKAIQKGIKTIYYRGVYHQRTEVRNWARETHNARFIYGDYIADLSLKPTI